jgi:hypothetical protein
MVDFALKSWGKIAIDNAADYVAADVLLVARMNRRRAMVVAKAKENIAAAMVAQRSQVTRDLRSAYIFRQVYPVFELDVLNLTGIIDQILNFRWNVLHAACGVPAAWRIWDNRYENAQLV